MIRGYIGLVWTCLILLSCSTSPEWPGKRGPQGTAGIADESHLSGGTYGLGESCRSDDSSRICLGLKYVVFNEGDQAVVTQLEALRNVRQINSVWAQCGIQFQIDQYQAVEPSDYSLAYRLSNYPELDKIRDRFADDRTLLIVTTGPWNRSGTLGNSSANAWTSMPRSRPFGVVMEKSVGKFPNIIAHELGHYLNLLHLNDSAELMNPIIYAKSTSIPPAQCAKARQAAYDFWAAAMR